MSKQCGTLGFVWLLVIGLLLPFPVEGKKKWRTVQHWREFYRANRERCNLPFVELGRAQQLRIGKRRFGFNGTRLVEKTKDADQVTRIGLISATRDSNGLTHDNIRQFIQHFHAAKVDWIVVNGDVGYDKENIIRNLSPFVRAKIPVLVVIGNGESIAVFNDAMADLMLKNDNIINLNFTRYIEIIDINNFFS